MKNVIKRLLDSDVTAYKISKDTGIRTSIISRLRSGKQSVSSSSYEIMKKLYQYQMNREFRMILGKERYSQYKSTVKEIKNSKDSEYRYKTLSRLNGNVKMALRDLLRDTDIIEDDNSEVAKVIDLLLDLLVLREHGNIREIETGIFEILENDIYVTIQNVGQFEEVKADNLEDKQIDKVDIEEESEIVQGVIKETDGYKFERYVLDVDQDKNIYHIHSSKNKDVLNQYINENTLINENDAQNVVDRMLSK